MCVKWWTNIIAADPFNPESEISYPVFTHPYRFNINFYNDKDFGLHICYSYDYRVFLDNSENGVPSGYLHAFGSDFIFGAMDFDTKPTYSIVDWDDYAFGVKIEIRNGNGPGLITTDLVTGMSFVTAHYHALTPRLGSVHQILTVNGQTINPVHQPSFTGNKFIVTNNRGQKWVIYASEEVTFKTELKSLDFTSVYQDLTLRVALLPDGTDESIYDLYSTCIVTGGSLEIYSESSYAIKWETKGDCSEGLLHLGLPHHSEVLDKTDLKDVGLNLYSTTRGMMTGWATTRMKPTTWTMNENVDIPVNGFFPPRAPELSLINNYNVRGILEDEINQDFLLDGFSYYFTGKQAQKYASMCLVASDTTFNTDAALVETCVAKLQVAFDKFLRNDFTYPLVYDEVYGGIVSSEGFARNDVNADFGSTAYNDHHFHYGVSPTRSLLKRCHRYFSPC
jgi:endo-1,3(4)-beta-glucanase